MRIRPLLPLLLSTIAVPAAAGGITDICYTAADRLGCLIEQAEFQRERNAEIDASIARVAKARSRELAMSLTHCKTRYSRTPRCNAERTQRFADHQNALIEASMARVAEVRAFEAARRAEADASMARVEARRTAELETRQNALIAASIAAVEVQRQRRFAEHQNALATASIQRVEAERSRQLAINMSPCIAQNDARPRCEAQRARDQVAHQRALANASIARVKAERDRAFAAARNAEVAASMAAVERARIAGEFSRIETATINAPTPSITAEEYAALTSHCIRVPASPRCEAERIRDFAAARNAEIERSLAAVARARASNDYASYTSHCVSNPETPRCEAERIREFAAERNAEIERSLAAVAAARANRQQEANLTHCKSTFDTSPRCVAERENNFDTARNNEIDRSIAAVAAARARGELGTPATTGVSPLETGAINAPARPRLFQMQDESIGIMRRDISTDPCRVEPFDPLLFTRGATIESSMTSQLDRLASLAEACPGARIEIQGYADGGSASSNRTLSQARAQAVADYLIANGVAPNRVAAIGLSGRHSVMIYGKSFAAYTGRAELIVRNPSTDATARRVMWDLAELLDPTYIPAVANLSP